MSRKTEFVLAVCGGSGSGKTTFATSLDEKLAQSSAILLQDNYYIDQSEKFDFDGGSVNFDHPESIDFDLMKSQIAQLKLGQAVRVPKYDFASHKRLEEYIEFAPPKVLIIDGILILSNPGLREVFDLSIFIETKESLRFERRLRRDVEKRGRSEQGVKDQFYKQVAPMHDQFVAPSQEWSNKVISGESPFDSKINELQHLISQKLP